MPRDLAAPVTPKPAIAAWDTNLFEFGDYNGPDPWGVVLVRYLSAPDGEGNREVVETERVSVPAQPILDAMAAAPVGQTVEEVIQTALVSALADVQSTVLGVTFGDAGG